MAIVSPSPDADRGLDALDTPVAAHRRPRSRVWSAAWPKLLAVAIVLAGWQGVVWSGWRPTYVLPPPATVFTELGGLLDHAQLLASGGITMQRIAARIPGRHRGGHCRRRRGVPDRAAAPGDRLADHRLQTMPSIVWFPFAILLFGLSESAILFVIVLGAAPAIANGLIAGVDHIPPILLARRAGARSPRTGALPARGAARRRCPPSSPGSSRAGRSPGAA